MTEIYISKTDKKHILKLEGHAGFGVYGTDIVCAAISILVCTWANELATLEERGEVKNVHCEQGEGYAMITFEGGNSNVKTAYETILTGLYMLEEKYSKNLCIRRGEKIF